MHLAVDLGHRSSAAGEDDPWAPVRLAQEAERLGYRVAWASEAYGTDAVTVLTAVAARTSTIDVGSAVLQLPARSAAMTAMTTASLDALSGGRFRLGLGVSGPQVSEGWHGVRFAAPLGRTREYVAVVRQALRREQVRADGPHLVLPLPDGPGKALRLSVRPLRPDVPVYLAAVGPRNLELAGEVADGWLGVIVAPEHLPESLSHLRAGQARSRREQGGAGGARPFDVVASVPALPSSGATAAEQDDAGDLAPLRARLALYVGGMGSREQNFYHALAVGLGHEREADLVQDLYLDRRHREAAAAVPRALVEATSLLGPPAAVRDRLAAYADAGATTLSVLPEGRDEAERVAVLRTVADALAASGRGS
ncbi:LLM class flavin-dependent oxidoreductase [Pseudokineococcus basanitobsidens]|uniref:LLM class flavin-dependent oxidoreductase n=1 Tax=Pseudokineococcus basanitobsidens TaxID=1926649 RepID=A0ABU8RLY5_9ACTN